MYAKIIDNEYKKCFKRYLVIALFSLGQKKKRT